MLHDFSFYIIISNAIFSKQYVGLHLDRYQLSRKYHNFIILYYLKKCLYVFIKFYQESRSKMMIRVFADVDTLIEGYLKYLNLSTYK